MTKLISASVGQRQTAKLSFLSRPARFSRAKRLACVLATALLLGQSAQAANTSTWTNLSGGDWSGAGNWTGTDKPPLAADTALFNAGSGTSIAVTSTSNNSIASISFDTAAGSYTIGATGSGTLTLGSGGTTQILSTLTATNAVETINAPVLLGGNYTFANNSANGAGAGAGTLDFGGTITGSLTSGTTTLTLSGSNTNANTISGVISNGGGTNVVALTKSGVGTWVLSGASTYTGATTVNAGTLDIGGSGSTGSITGSALVLGGGTLSYTTTGSGTQTFTGTTFSLNSGHSTINVASGNTVALGAITRNAGSTIDFGDSAGSVSTTSTGTNGILGGYATFQGNTWAVGGGVITGLASGSYTAATAGTTAPGTAANVDFQANNSTAWATQTINSLRFNTGAATTLTLSGTLIDATGGILVTNAVGSNLSTITGGTLEGASGKDLVAIVNDTGGLTIGSIIANNSSSTGLTKTGTGTLTLTAADTYTGATVIDAGTLSFTNSLASTSFTTTANGTGSISESSTGVIGGAATVTQSSTGTSVLAGNNTYGGATAVNAGTLVLSGNNTGAGGVTVSAGATLDINSAGTDSTNSAVGTGTITLSLGTIDNTSAGNIVLATNNAISLNAGVTFGGTHDLNLGTGAVSVSQNNTAVTLDGINSTLTFGGTTTLTGGGASNISVVVSNGAGGSGNTFVLNNLIIGTTQAAPNALFSGTANIIISGVVSNDATGNSTLQYSGTGTMTVLGENTFTGGSNLATGTLLLGSSTVSGATITSGPLGTGTLTIVSGTILDNGTNITLANSVADKATSITFGSTGGGSLTFDGTGLTTPATFVMTANTVFTVNNTTTIKDAVSGAARLTKSGTGTLILSGTNTYTSTTVVNNGTLQFAKEASLYTGLTGSWTAANITVASGATLALNVGGTGEFTAGDVNTLLTAISVAGTSTGLQAGSNIGFDTTNAAGGTFTQGNVIANSTGTKGGAIGVTKLGVNTLELNQANTYTGGTTVTSGSLLVNNTTGSGTGTGAVLVSSGAILGGTGTINTSGVASGKGVDIASGAILSPSGGVTTGFSHLTLNVQSGSTVSLDAGSKLAFNLGSATATSDEVLVTGGGKLALNGQDFSDFTFNAQDGTASGTYTLIDSTGGITGLLGSSLTGSFDGGLYTGTLFLSGNDLDLTVVAQSVPEPGTWAMLLGGLGLLLIIRRRRNRLNY